MIEISHLVVDGCSLTYCQGLEKPHIDGWPALLAKKIGVPVVNLALPGSSNDGIHRRLYNYVYKSIDFYNQNQIETNPFYIPAFTFAGRREEFFKKYYLSSDTERYFCLDLSPDFAKIKDIIDNRRIDENAVAAYVEYGYILNFDLLAANIKKLEYWASLINLFKVNNLNYATGDYIPTYDEEVLYTVKSRYKHLNKIVFEDKNYFGDFSHLLYTMPKLPCGHDGLEAQHMLAEYIYYKILEIYGEISVKKVKNVYGLKQFYITHPSSKLVKSGDWYKN